MKKLKAFTLIEMLIVIVIISILAAALLPKMGSAQAIARDAARKADLQTIAQAIVAYQIGNGDFPNTAGSVENISGDLINAGLDQIPQDPKKGRSFNGIGNNNCNDNTITGNYGYTPITKYGISNNGFVLMAATETEGGSNRVYDSANNNLKNLCPTSKFEDIKENMCTSFSSSTTTSLTGGNCIYQKDGNVLRYIYLY